MPLADPAGVVAQLRATIDPYPQALQTALIANLWQASFLVKTARKGLPKRDTAYVMLCCSTALMLCAHAWHAAANSWPTNEKGLVVDVAGLALDTHDFSARADRALGCGAADARALESVIDCVTQIVDDTRSTLDPDR